MSISLIANSGLQFYQCSFEINPNEEVLKKNLRFYEYFDTENFTIQLQFAELLSEFDVWVTRKSLKEEGFIDNRGRISEDVNPASLEIIPEDQRYSTNAIEIPLEKFENKWLPIPFFEIDTGGNFAVEPTNWCRMKYRLVEKVGNIRKYECVMVFDTKSYYNSKSKESPFFFDAEHSKKYKISADPEMTLGYLSSENQCEWVNDYIKKIYLGDDNKEIDSLKYAANYIFFIQYLAEKEIFPELKLLSDENVDKVDVDVSIDIGNSSTCVLLFDDIDNHSAFDKVKKLELMDLSDPFNTYNDPFDMRLAFHKADFGDIKFLDDSFTWPSIVRVGREASRLIYNSKNNMDAEDESLTHYSSPKKYLWDTEASKQQWEFIYLQSDNPIKSVYLQGISEQFNKDGTLSDGDYDVEGRYSRRSLMTFVFLEIFAHIFRQINSYDFRSTHGKLGSPRKINKVVISCPTAMPRAEQIELRKAADEAHQVLQKFYGTGISINENSFIRKDLTQIVPTPRDLSLDLTNIKDKNDWSYDEATCCQLVFVYAEIAQRYLNNCTEYFNTYGKVRADLEEYNEKSITIGSIDIGAGTTDLMISAYKYSDEGKVVLTPVPLYWESFYYAGDDLTKEVIHQILIENTMVSDESVGTSGLISAKLKSLGVPNPHEKINDFFGEDTNRIDFKGRKMRSDFNVQVSLPIALKLLEMVRNEEADQELMMSELFGPNKPKKEILDYFSRHFGFRFEELKLNFSLDRLNHIVVRVFEPLLKKLSSLLYAYGCDFVLIAGRPTSLKEIEELFLKFYPVSPDRLVTLNTYRVGKWYPFADGSGYFENHKSIVAVGSMIAMLGGKYDKLGNFKINTDYLKYKVLPTSDYFGIFNINTKRIDKDPVITPEINRQTIEVAGTPMYFGCKQLDSEAYPARMMYVFDFNEENIKERIIERNSPDADKNLITREIEDFKFNLRRNMPFTLRLYREFRTDREVLKIESITDVHKDEVSPKYFDFKLQTLSEKNMHWTDSGEFILTIHEN